MINMNRRDLCVALTSLVAATAAAPADGQTTTASSGATPTPPQTVLSVQRAYPFEDLPVKEGPNGEGRAVLNGVLPTGEAVEVHETTLLPGHMPHPAHKHRHSELMLIREGTVEFNNDGTLQRVGPGGVIFAASNVMHGLKNVGEINANYFVIAIGTELPVRPA
jgi:quercetin dioxygenase-like cupin family protein